MTAVSLGALPAGRRSVLQRRVRRLVATTITYNVVEAVVAISAGIGASSVALVGFGLDSTIEVASALAVAWQFAGRDVQARERPRCESSPSRSSHWPPTCRSRPSGR